MLVSFLIINTYCPLLFHQLGQIDRWASNFYLSFPGWKTKSLVSPCASQQQIRDLKSGLSDPRPKLLATGTSLPCGLPCHIGGLCDWTAHCWLNISRRFSGDKNCVQRGLFPPWTVGIWCKGCYCWIQWTSSWYQPLALSSLLTSLSHPVYKTGNAYCPGQINKWNHIAGLSKYDVLYHGCQLEMAS